MNQQPVILFDGICNLCCGWVHFLIKKDKNFRFMFASLQSASGKRLLHTVGLQSQIMDSIIYLKGNQAYLESSAVLEILKDIGGIWKIAGILIYIPLPIRDGIYHFIAKRRYRYFGKRASCLLPTPENKKRFLT